MIIYYLILVIILYLLLTYSNESIDSRELCVYISLGIVLLFILIKLRRYFTMRNKKKYVKIAIPTTIHKITSEIKPEIVPEIKQEVHGETNKLPQPYTLTMMNEELYFIRWIRI